MKPNLKYFLSCCLLFMLDSLGAQGIVEVGQAQLGATLYPAIEAEYLEDETGKLTFEQVQSQKFISNKASSLNFGYSLSTFWVRLRLKNNTAQNDWRLLSFIAYHNYLDSWQQLPSGKWKTTKTGWLYPFKSRGSFEHVGFVFPMDLPQGVEKTIYFRLSGYDPLTFPLELIQKQPLDLKFQKENIYYGIYFGVLAIMLLYNLFIYFTLLDRNYLYYVAYILCMLIIFSASTGYLFRYLHPNYPLLNLYSSRITMGIIVIMTSLFTIHFLELKKYISWLYRVFQIDMGLAVVAMLLTGTELYSSATNDLLSLHSPLLLMAGIMVWRKGNQSARYYVLAWGIFLVGATIISLRNMGLLPVNAFTTHTVEVGSALEIVLLSLALADRYRILRIEKEKATEKALVIQQKANENLERKVKERTIELSESNAELRQINEELDATLHTVKLQKDAIEEQNTQINASIHYAQRIQQAILPLDERLEQILPDHFVFYQPRDIVSGDFYWVDSLDDKLYIVVGDCTGHGVPGAFMTMLGVQALDQIILQKKIAQPDEILNTLGQTLPALLKSKDTSVNDGMDIAVIVLDKHKKELHFAGAGASIILAQNDELKQVKGDNLGINGFIKKFKQVSYTSHFIDISLPTMLYLYTDGYQDQFGGKVGKKFMRRRFRDLLFSIKDQPITDQHQTLQSTLEDWMEGYRQVDDILVMGINIDLL